MSSIAFSLIHQYGSIAAFVLLALEYVGFPVPGEPIMSMLGFISSNNNITLLIAILFCICGTFTGSMIAYFIGLKIGEPIIITLGRLLHISQDKLFAMREKFIKNEAAIIIFSRFIPGFRHIIPYLSGTVKIKMHKYILLNLFSSVVWCIFFLLSGILFKNLWQYFDGIARIISLTVLAAIIVAYIILRIVKHKRKI